MNHERVCPGFQMTGQTKEPRWSLNPGSGLELQSDLTENTFWYQPTFTPPQCPMMVKMPQPRLCVFQACAPLYQWSTFGVSEREPVGTCFLKKGSRVVEYSPCRSGLICESTSNVLTLSRFTRDPVDPVHMNHRSLLQGFLT